MIAASLVVSVGLAAFTGDAGLAIAGDAARGPARAAARGRVVYVTSQRAYLNRGTADGLGKGDAVELSRNGRMIALCTVELVADHSAVCRTPAARPGDGFRVSPAGRLRERQVTPRTLPPVVAGAVLRERAAAIAVAPHDKGEFSRRIAV